MGVLRKRERTEPVKRPSLVASAKRLTRVDLARVLSRGGNDWQEQAWNHYESVGELRYGVGWISNAISRATLCIVEGDTDVPDPVRAESGPAVDYLNALFNGPAGQAQMLKAFGLQLSVPGECYVVGYRVPDSDDVHWCVASKDEIVRQGDVITLERGDGISIKLTDEDWILRVWISSPRKWWQADSAVKGLLPVLRELDELTKKVFASIDSRLAGNGIFILPSEATFPQSNEEGEEQDDFNSVLHKAMITPLQDRDVASAVVPIVIQVPGDQIGNIRHITFGHDLDSQVTPLRDSAVRRIAIGLDIPAEVQLGLGNANHWSAWQIEESAIKLHIEPLLATICDALTTGYLWPLMGGDKTYSIWFDTSELTERPDRGPDASAVYDRGELSGEALRRHYGFNDDEAPADQERLRRELLDLVKTNPELLPLVLKAIGVVKPDVSAVPLPGPMQGGDTISVPNEATPEPAPEQRALPAGQSEPPSSVAASGAMTLGMVMACDMAVVRALEVAGKKIRSTKLPRAQQGQYQNVPAWTMHTHVPVGEHELDKLLDGAWVAFAAAVPECEKLAPALDGYVRLLLQHGVAHERRCLADVVRKAVSSDAVS